MIHQGLIKSRATTIPNKNLIKMGKIQLELEKKF